MIYDIYDTNTHIYVCVIYIHIFFLLVTRHRRSESTGKVPLRSAFSCGTHTIARKG